MYVYALWLILCFIRRVPDPTCCTASTVGYRLSVQSNSSPLPNLGRWVTAKNGVDWLSGRLRCCFLWLFFACSGLSTYTPGPTFMS
ncbi:hypothetical protein M432DRAFT_204487 [Thermoascus aurantiacus ATCC 26904]